MYQLHITNPTSIGRGLEWPPLPGRGPWAGAPKAYAQKPRAPPGGRGRLVIGRRYPALGLGRQKCPGVPPETRPLTRRPPLPGCWPRPRGTHTPAAAASPDGGHPQASPPKKFRPRSSLRRLNSEGLQAPAPSLLPSTRPARPGVTRPSHLDGTKSTLRPPAPSGHPSKSRPRPRSSTGARKDGPTPHSKSPPSVGSPKARINGQIKAARAYAQ